MDTHPVVAVMASVAGGSSRCAVTEGGEMEGEGCGCGGGDRGEERRVRKPLCPEQAATAEVEGPVLSVVDAMAGMAHELHVRAAARGDGGGMRAG